MEFGWGLRGSCLGVSPNCTKLYFLKCAFGFTLFLDCTCLASVSLFNVRVVGLQI